MNILIYSENEVLPQNGGTERSTHILVDFLRKNKYKVNYLIKNDLKKNLNKKDTYCFPDNSDLLAENNIKFLNNLISENSITLIILTIPTPKLYYLLEKIEERPIVITIIHASIKEFLPHFLMIFKLGFNNPIETFQSLLKSTRLPFLYFLHKKKLKTKFNLINKHSDRIVVLSENYIQDLVSFNKEIRENKIVCIENFNPFKIENINFKKFQQVIFIGRLTYLKRVDHILKGWDFIKLNTNGWHLNIVGTGEEEDSLKKIVKDNKMGNVSFAGNKDPRIIYESSSIICLTSIYEGMPMVIIEALQFGVVPIIYNTFGAATDLIEDGENGFLIEPFDYKCLGEKVSYLINHPEELNRMRNNAFESSKKFDLNNVGNKWLKLLQNVN